MLSETQLRQTLASYSRKLWERGWVANHDGNLSVKLPRERLLCTPGAVSKASVTAESLIVVDATGKVLSRGGRAFSELNLHWAYYHRRADIGAVIHAHPPTATGFALAGVSLDAIPLPEAVVSLGPQLPTIPFALPGTDAAQAMEPYLDDYDALLLTGNGVITCGIDLEQAYLRMELVEHLCKIILVAKQLGSTPSLPPHFLKTLLEARKKAGLGPEARGRSALVDTLGDNTASSTVKKELEKTVRDEIERVLKDSDRR